MEAADGVRVLKSTVARRGCAPKYIRSDNGPEFVAKAMRERIAEKGFETLYIIKPGSPWQNAYSESFNSLMRDARLNVESFGILLEAKVPSKAWREAYNHQRLHSSLGYRTPEAFAQQCLQAACAPLRQPEGIASSQTTQEITPQTNPPARLRLSSKLAQTSGALQQSPLLATLRADLGLGGYLATSKHAFELIKKVGAFRLGAWCPGKAVSRVLHIGSG